MPRDGNNVYSLPSAPFTVGTAISVTPTNSNFSDIATALTDSFTRGETTAYTRTLLDDADAATARGTLGAMAQSQAGAGIGQFVPINQSGFTTYNLPAGGTWEYFMIGQTAANLISGYGGGIAAGGTQVFNQAGVTIILGYARRIA